MKKRQLNVRRLYSPGIGWIFLFFGLFFILFPVYATATIHENTVLNVDLIITGVVTDSKTGEPLTGVSVIPKGTTNGTITDDNGMYKIQTKENSTLIFSAVGYISQEIIVNRRVIINVALQGGISNLNEVVVIGYGKQKASNITGAIAKISAQDLDERPTSRIDHAMAGKLSGVQVQEISGTPGKAFSVKVRGTSSISNSSSPLYVVDGYPISSGLDNINPNDIESIEVLKDAASAAIYGSRGSSGVVLITTKTGKGGKPVLQFDANYGIQERFSKVDVLNRDEYIAFAIEERNNTWKLQGGNPSDPNSARSSSNYWIDPLWLTNPSSFPDNDWQDLISRKAPVQNYQLSASGSNENVKYFISGNYFNQQGIILNSYYKRLSFRANVETKIGKRVNLGLNLFANSLNSNDNGSDGNSGPVSRSTRVAPIVGLTQQTEAGGYYPFHAAFYLNPIALAKEITNETNGKNILANIFTTINLAKNLSLRSSLGANYTDAFVQYYLPNDINRGVGSNGRISSSYVENYLNENILTYNIEKSSWNVNALAGFTYQDSKTVSEFLDKGGFPDDEIRTLNMGTILNSGSSSATAWSLMSFLSRISTSWKNKYLLSASIRRDGSSRFGADNQWGWFPALSVGWRIGQETFMQKVDFINEMKLRASYGTAGNNSIGDYAAIGSLSSANYVIGLNQGVVPGFIPGSFSNRTLGWEKTYTFDVGLDLSVFSNRISMSFDYYRADVKDLLLNVQIPPISGFSSAVSNVGAIRNTGLELELNTANLTGRFKWNTSFNISHNKNKVIALGSNGAPIYGNGGYNFIVTITQIGKPIGSYYMFQQNGVFKDQKDFDLHPHYKTQNIGDIKYEDINGDGVIDADDRTIVGNNSPKYFWGLQNSFSYQNFDLAVSMDGQWGNKLLDIGNSQAGQSRGNVDGYWRERWRSPEDPGNGWVPRAAVTSNLTTPSTFWLRDASYLRVRTIALGFSVPRSFIAKVKGISGLRLFASVDNVFMHDHFNHNPQTGTYSNTNTNPGVDFDSAYPLARTFTFGITVKF